MLSQVKIYNMALARLGGNQIETINSPYEDGGTTSLCNRTYPLVLHSTLCAHNWGFATRTVPLAQKTENQGGLYTYALPSGYIKAIQVEGSGSLGLRPLCILRGQNILTDVPDAVLRYIGKEENPDAWPPYFVNTIVWGLAAELAISLQNDARLQQRMGEQYLTTLHEAIAIDLNQQTPLAPESPWLEAR